MADSAKDGETATQEITVKFSSRRRKKWNDILNGRTEATPHFTDRIDRKYAGFDDGATLSIGLYGGDGLPHIGLRLVKPDGTDGDYGFPMGDLPLDATFECDEVTYEARIE